MLVLTRKAEQTIHIGRHITVTILRIKGRTVKVGIQAPSVMQVLRGELAEDPFDLCWPLRYNGFDTLDGAPGLPRGLRSSDP